MAFKLLTDEVAKLETGYTRCAIMRKFNKGEIPNNGTIMKKWRGQWHINSNELSNLIDEEGQTG